MAQYLILFHFTHQGMDHLKGSPDRIAAIKAAAARHKVKVKEFYSLMGQYDSMFIVEAPADEAVAQLSLTIGAQGNVRTETLRAFNEEEFRKLVTAATA
jgi:uncharacterized protein with GYD domain